MQPWLDFTLRETGCRRCGRPFHDGDVHVWACRERTRRFDFEGARSQRPGLIRYEEVSRAYAVCGACLQILERGGHMGGAALGRLVLLLLGVLALWLAGGPVAHRWGPNVLSAFYRDGSTGR